MPALAKKDLPVGDIEISKPVEKYMDKYMNKDKQPPEEEMNLLVSRYETK